MNERMTNQEIEAEVEAAFARTEAFHFPKALAVEYSPGHRDFIVSFEGRFTVTVPQERFAEVLRRDEGALSNVVVSESGYALEWPALDVSYDLPELIDRIFGTLTHPKAA